MEHGAGTVETAHERLFQQLKIAVVASGELCLDLENREEVPLHCGGSTAGELEEIGVPLVRHDAGAGCQLAGKGEIAELLSAEYDDVLAKPGRSEEHTSELQSQSNLVCRLLLEKKNNKLTNNNHLH